MRRAFVLIDRSVVIAKIVVPAGMLMPTIGAVDDQAKSNEFQSNLHRHQTSAFSSSLD